MKRIYLVAVAMLLPLTSLNAQQPSAAQLKFFETKIRPALVKYCYECHSVEGGGGRAGLLVDSRAGLSEGGDSGPAIVPGKPDESLLWEAINWDSYEMPPSEKMPAKVIASFKQWIEMGAPDPRERELLVHKTKISPADIEEGRKHWAFQPPQGQGVASIDSLVAAKLRAAGLTPAGPADGYTLLRRINFDLIGLPPEPAEIQAFQVAFQQDPDAAIKTKVNELLADRSTGRDGGGTGWMWLATPSLPARET